MYIDLNDIDKFWSKVYFTDNCWEWQGGKTGVKGKAVSGYGAFWTNGRQRPAHEVAYFLTKGIIPIGKQIRHTCDNPGCVNPDHLILGTQSDNILDAVKRNRRNDPLNEQAVKVIRWMLKHCPKRGLQSKLAKLHKVNKKAISKIHLKQTWQWVTI